MTSYVYFIQQGRRGPIKIGVTQGNPSQRLIGLQTGNPKLLYLRGVATDHTGGLERRLHKQLVRSLLRGEWYSPTAEVLEVVKGYSDPEPCGFEDVPRLPRDREPSDDDRILERQHGSLVAAAAFHARMSALFDYDEGA